MQDFSEFTEDGFRSLLQQLVDGGYRFAAYGDFGDDRHVIWRHDLDLSVHRAARLARIEAEMGAVATYFVNTRSTFYNAAEPAVARRLNNIASLGHEIGLHFDAEPYGITEWDFPTLDRAVERERAILELILDAPVRTISWHNPDLSNLLEFGEDELGGLINAYSTRLRSDYTYASDSNGYWRFRPMAEVIAERPMKLHLLTHPGWWTPEPTSPSARIDRAICGRAHRVRSDYDTVVMPRLAIED